LAESGLGLKRGRGPDAVGDLQQHSKQLRMLGQDPLPATLHQAQLAGLHQGPFSQVIFAITLMSAVCKSICCHSALLPSSDCWLLALLVMHIHVLPSVV